MFAKFKSLFDPSKKNIKEVQSTVDEVKTLRDTYKDKSLEELQTIIKEIREELHPLIEAIPEKYKSSIKAPKRNKDYVAKEQAVQDTLLKNLPKVYAATGEVLRRRVGYVHYDVQLVASTILAQGYKLTEL
ncbi:hypothetical protein KC717_05905, partial [Candidatus Dojkabacteria bacterium]|nr:hypothetical protein [Candidatus Dojkabacteria bacterium]